MESRELRIDLNDWATFTQIRDTLDWAFWHVKTDRATEFHSRELGAVFRNTRISSWLRANLLRQVGTYAVGEHAYSYLLREDRWDKLSGYVNGLTWAETNALLRPEVTSNIVRDGVEELVRPDYPSSSFLPRTHLEKGLSTDFEYRDWNHRLWNGLQNINADDKPLYWKGIFPWDFDISNSAPTTLFQLATMFNGSRMLLEPVKHYLDFREEYLRFVMQSCRVSRKVAKKFFTSVFNGAVLSTSYRQSTLGTLGGNVAGVERLKESVGIRSLLSSIKYMNLHLQRAFGEDPWLVYFRYERANLDIMRAHLDSIGARYFLEHDGFRCDRQVDSEFLVAEIERQTGLRYAMKAKHHVYEPASEEVTNTLFDDASGESGFIIELPLSQNFPFDYRKQPNEDVPDQDHLR